MPSSELLATEAPKEVLVDPHTIVIATTIFYPKWQAQEARDNSLTEDCLRGDLALVTVRSALDRGYQVVVVDGGSSDALISELTTAGISVVKQEEKGMSASRRQAFSEASQKPDGKIIAWLEPEKISVVDFLQELSAPILKNEADIVVPARTEKGFTSYPVQQAQSERRFNHYWSKALRIAGLLHTDDPDFDIAFGPRVFRNAPDVLDVFFAKYKLRKGSRYKGILRPDAYSNATFFPIISALHRGLRVKSIPVNYVHPKSQTEFESSIPAVYDRKRNDQRRDIVKGAVELIRYIISDPNKKSELEEERAGAA